MFFFYMSVFWLVGWLVEVVPEENNCIVGALLLFLVWQLVYKAFKKMKMRHEGKD